MTEEEARKEFQALRFAGSDGMPICPACNTSAPYFLSTRQVWKCRACHRQFSLTTGTPFTGRKLSFVDIIRALDLARSGANSLQIARALNVQYNTAWRIRQKIDEFLRL